MRGLALLRKLASKFVPERAGYVDHFDMDRVAGWAVDPSGSGEPAVVGLFIDGKHVMNVAAELPRDDVAQTRRAPLRCGFDIALPKRLRDGNAHRVDVHLGEHGQRLRNGRMNIPAGTAGRGSATGLSGALVEGVTWFDRSKGAISGWATGSSFVTLSVNGQTPTQIPLNREVPGFGAGNRQGFEYILPDALIGDDTHTIDVRAGHWADNLGLDGNPLSVCLQAVRPRLYVNLDGPRRLNVLVRNRSGEPDPSSLSIEINGKAVIHETSTPGAVGAFLVQLPEDARYLTVSTRPTQLDTGYVLGRFAIAADGTPTDWSAEVSHLELDTIPLAPDLLARARTAFDAFTTSPDDRFEPQWVAAQLNLNESENVFDAWCDRGAAAGIAPGPTFDNAAACALNPGVADAVARGQLPCAFALELVLGAGALGSMSGRAIPTGRSTSPPLATTNLPPVSLWCDPSESIFAAWLARLKLAPKELAKLDNDERASRQEVSQVVMTRQPLVSIIMPSWNRAFTIGEAIQSVIEQSYPNWELLICDDASEDRTADVVRGFNDSRIKYMRFQKSNGAGARNHGLRQAQGEYIAYLDSDNMWHPLFLDVMLRQLIGTPGVPIAYSAYLDTETQGATVKLSGISAPGFRPIQLSNKNFMDLNTIVHHRRVLDWLGGFDGALPRLQDWDLVLRYTSIFGAKFVNRIGVFYRRNLAWGQVTHTQQGSGAQDTVNGKTQARLAGAHEVLNVEWPAPSRVTMICGASAEAIATSTALAHMTTELGTIDLVQIGGPDIAHNMPGIDRYRRVTDVRALDTELLDFGAAPVLVSGLDDRTIRQLHNLDPNRTFRATSRSTGTWLEPLSGPKAAFPLGALTLDPAQVATHPMPHKTDGPILILGHNIDAQDTRWVTPLRDAGFEALVPPSHNQPGWTHVTASGTNEIETDMPHLPAEISDVSLVLVMGRSLDEISPWQFALLNTSMGNAVPVAIPTDKDPESFANQWVDARAAYGLTSNAPEWIFDKIPKLFKDAKKMTQLSERAHLVHRIALAPELTGQRMVHFAWCQQFAPPKTEDLNGA